MKNTLIATLVVILATAALLALIVWGSSQKKGSQNQPVLTNNNETNEMSASSSGELVFYYGNTCPHCKDVEEWMNSNKIEEKLKITKKEVYDNQNNASELVSTAQKCGLNTSSIGVPFLYTQEGKCLIGTPDIINYLKEKANL
ncbi:MAG: hypothetical protein KatS3mg088_332 [Patescibacteria group bacterium]|nr:MAG: hypothetical protein KatS3mg088_332 [Patescibacteria group bacterium]